MSLKLLVLAVLVTIVSARLRILVDIDQDKKTVITHSGEQADVITDEDVNLFKIGNETLNEAVLQHIGKRPTNVYLKKPTPGGNWYWKHNWQPVKRVISIKSAKVTRFSNYPTILRSKYYSNLSNKIKSAVIDIAVDKINVITTRWPKDIEIKVPQYIKHEFVAVCTEPKVSGFFFTPVWGLDDRISQVQNLGAEIPLRDREIYIKPEETATVNLNGYSGFLDVEIEYSVSLTGNLTFKFMEPYKDKRLWALLIQDVMKTANISNEITTVEKIQLEYYTSSNLEVDFKKYEEN